MHAEYTDAHGRRGREQVVSAASPDARAPPTAISLRDSWRATELAPGDVLHLAPPPGLDDPPPPDPPGQRTVSDHPLSPLLILHPDHLLSATTVADSIECPRKAVLQERVRGPSAPSPPTLHGKLLHDVFQRALAADRWDRAALAALIDRALAIHVDDLWELAIDPAVLAADLLPKTAALAPWAATFVAPRPVHERARLDDGARLSVARLVAVEEHVWSPRFGLKGNIDATVETAVADSDDSPRRLLAPLELKTGRTSRAPAHVAQTALYTLLLADRYAVPVRAGLLFYLESATTLRIAPPPHELRQLVQLRNRLAAAVRRARHPTAPDAAPAHVDDVDDATADAPADLEASALPPLLRDPFKCGRCHARTTCFTYHALAERGSAATAGMQPDARTDHTAVWRAAVGHLPLHDARRAPRLRAWFATWDRLLTWEEQEMGRFRREIWTMESPERERAGRCWGRLVLKGEGRDVDEAARIDRFAYRFVRAAGAALGSFVEPALMAVGEPVVVSSESGQWALATGFVTGVSAREVAVAVDRPLDDARRRLRGFDRRAAQTWKGIMVAGKTGRADDVDDAAPVLYRIDKDEFSNGLGAIRHNLVALMADEPICTKLRDLIVLDAPPTFAPAAVGAPRPSADMAELNDDQRAAVDKVLAAQDYALILGMPGTGKTTTIACLMRALLAAGKTVLLTSFTHTAVDNILLKMRALASEHPILRVGAAAKIHPDVRAFCQLTSTPRADVAAVDAAFTRCRVVAATCMGVAGHALFRRRAFDVCIVDEASQITLPTALGPLLRARAFVLVGDHHQLPPLVQSPRARRAGLDASLFRQLADRHPAAVADLTRQYRMCADIMALANTLTYAGRLRCGTPAVAARALHAPHLARLDAAPRWLQHVCRPDRAVVFADTDAAGRAAHESRPSAPLLTNAYEAALVALALRALLAAGVPAPSIAVIAPYRAQLALLRRVCAAAGAGEPQGIEFDSPDRFQGRDKDVVLLSLTRSSASNAGNDADDPIDPVGPLLRDPRRVNVALTRARAKLVLIGSRRTLSADPLLARLLALVDARGWALELPADADRCHAWGGVGASPDPSPDPPRAPPASTSAPRARSPTKPVVREGGGKAAAGMKTPSRARVASKRGAAVREAVAFEILADADADVDVAGG